MRVKLSSPHPVEPDDSSHGHDRDEMESIHAAVFPESNQTTARAVMTDQGGVCHCPVSRV